MQGSATPPLAHPWLYYLDDPQLALCHLRFRLWELELLPGDLRLVTNF